MTDKRMLIFYVQNIRIDGVSSLQVLDEAVLTVFAIQLLWSEMYPSNTHIKSSTAPS
jgi:hypothetical protein